jgi:glycosyltransferase involved in cell wall biosynthesis/Flp pilus assembly protein TadD
MSEAADMVPAGPVGTALADRLREVQAFVAQGRYGDAARLVKGGAGAAPAGREAKIQRAKALEAAGDRHGARLLWTEIAREGGGDGQHLWRLGRNAANRGDHAEAEQMLSAYLEVAPGDLAAAELLLESRLALAADQAARRVILDRHAAAWPETALLLALTAAEALRADNPHAARLTLAKAEGMWSSAIPAALRIAETREALGDTDGALAMIDRALAVHPRAPALWQARLRAQQAAGHAKEALFQTAARLVEVEPDRARSHVVHARLCAQYKDWAAAAAAWRRALDLDRSAVEHWRGLFIALGSLERNAAIEKLLVEARAWFRDRGEEGQVDLATLESVCGWHDRAVALAVGAMANPAVRPRARDMASAALMRAGQYVRAWRYLSDAVQDGTASPETLRLAVRCAAALRVPAPAVSVPAFPDALFERALLNPPVLPHAAPEPVFMLVSSSLAAGGAERQVALSAAGVGRAVARAGRGRVVLVGQDLDPQRGRAVMRPLAETADVTIEDLGPREETAIFRGIAASDPAARPALELIAALPDTVARDVVKLYDCFRRFRPEVVHLWQDGVITSGSVAAVLAGVPRIVASMRNVVATEQDRRRYRRYLGAMYKALAQRPEVHFTANSQAGATDYERWLGSAPGSIRVLRNGLDLRAVQRRAPPEARQAVRDALGLGPDELLVGGTFRLAPAKRPHLWISVAEQVAARVPRARFAIVGDGTLRVELEALIASRGLSNRITLAGRKSPVEPWIAAMDVMLLASEVEGLPNVLLEAQALGVPVVTTDAGGSSEALLNGVTGLLVPDDSVGTLAEAVTRVLNDGAMRARTRVGAATFIEQRFGLGRMISDTLAVYGVPELSQGGT